MKLLALEECRPHLSGTRFRATPEGTLTLDNNLASKQRRLAGGPAREVSQLGSFSEYLLRWLPSAGGKLLLFQHWEPGLNNAFETFQAVRTGLRESRDVASAPALYVPPHSWTFDIDEITPEQAYDSGILVGILFLVMGSGWDTWLIAEAVRMP
jgi:hypothetical protein